MNKQTDKIKCAWFQCQEKPTIYSPKMQKHFCEDHFTLNILRGLYDPDSRHITKDDIVNPY
jgi:hypothetical protein